MSDSEAKVGVRLKEICFFCLKYHNSKEKESFVQMNSASIDKILRYFKLGDRDAFSCLQNVYNSDTLCVPLCEDCDKITKIFEEQHRLLELTKLRLQGTSQQITGIMNGAHLSNDIRDLYGMKNLESVRAKIIKKAQEKNYLCQPQVTLKRCNPVFTNNFKEIPNILNGNEVWSFLSCDSCADLKFQNDLAAKTHGIIHHCEKYFETEKKSHVTDELFQGIVMYLLFDHFKVNDNECILCGESFPNFDRLTASEFPDLYLKLHLITKESHMKKLKQKLNALQNDPTIETQVKEKVDLNQNGKRCKCGTFLPNPEAEVNHVENHCRRSLKHIFKQYGPSSELEGDRVHRCLYCTLKFVNPTEKVLKYHLLSRHCFYYFEHKKDEFRLHGSTPLDHVQKVVLGYLFGDYITFAKNMSRCPRCEARFDIPPTAKPNLHFINPNKISKNAEKVMDYVLHLVEMHLDKLKEKLEILKESPTIKRKLSRPPSYSGEHRVRWKTYATIPDYKKISETPKLIKRFCESIEGRGNERKWRITKSNSKIVSPSRSVDYDANSEDDSNFRNPSPSTSTINPEVKKTENECECRSSSYSDSDITANSTKSTDPVICKRKFIQSQNNSGRKITKTSTINISSSSSDDDLPTAKEINESIKNNTRDWIRQSGSESGSSISTSSSSGSSSDDSDNDNPGSSVGNLKEKLIEISEKESMEKSPGHYSKASSSGSANRDTSNCNSESTTKIAESDKKVGIHDPDPDNDMHVKMEVEEGPFYFGNIKYEESTMITKN